MTKHKPKGSRSRPTWDFGSRLRGHIVCSPTTLPENSGLHSRSRVSAGLDASPCFNLMSWPCLLSSRSEGLGCAREEQVARACCMRSAAFRASHALEPETSEDEV